MSINLDYPLVSVIIPTYNRYRLLLNAVKSVKSQTYPNIEIIVVNDGSDQPEYKNIQIMGIVMINLENKNSRTVCGYPCGGYVRNIGMKNAKGNYIAFLDDDDIWLPTKIEKQVNIMKTQIIEHRNSPVLFCCTDGYIGRGIYESQKKEEQQYQKYVTEKFWDNIKQVLIKTRPNWNQRDRTNQIPQCFDLPLIEQNNCIICSSVMIHRDILSKIGYMNHIPNWGFNGEYQDWDFWKRILTITDCYFLNEPLIYYDETPYKMRGY